MKQAIIKAITEVGLNANDFIIGNGARGNASEIHYFPSNYKRHNVPRKKYSIQYCDDIIAIWEIGKRLDIGATIDMNWDGVCWQEINELRVKEIRIQNSNESTVAAVMPFILFQDYLRCSFDNDEREQLYISYTEGEKAEIYTAVFERNKELRKQAINIHGTRCQVCGLSFAEKYGDIGEGFIEVHHIKPISGGPRVVNPETDLVCLCSNCHSMIHHRKNYVMTIEELRAKINSVCSMKEI